MIQCSKCDHSTDDFKSWGYKCEREVYICTSCKKAQKALRLKKYRQENADKITQQRQEYRSKNKIKLCEDAKQRYHKNREEKIAKRKKDSLDPNSAFYKWKLKNKERLRLKAKEYRQKENYYSKLWQYSQERLKTDINFKLVTSLRSQVSSALKNLTKYNKTIPLLGCSISELRLHLEASWQEGMSWENYGRHGWHIDHIKPCCTFDLSLEEDQKACFHYTNLRALWAKDNLSRPKDGSDLTN